MAIESALVSKNASNQPNVNTDFESPGFGEPDLVLFWAGELGSDNAIRSSMLYCVGWYDGTGGRMVSPFWDHNQTRTVTTRIQDGRYQVGLTNQQSYQGMWSATWLPDGVRLHSERTGNPADRNYPVYALLLKGIRGTYTTYVDAEAGALQTVTCGFKPHLIIATHIAHDVFNMSNPTAEAVFGVGYATETQQKSFCMNGDNASITGENVCGHLSSLVSAYAEGFDTLWYRADAKNFTDTGFDIEWTPGFAASNDIVNILALDLGDNGYAEILEGTTTANQEKTLEFQAGDVILGHTLDNLYVAEEVGQNEDVIGYGSWIAAPSVEASMSFSDQDTADPTVTKFGRWSTSLKALDMTGTDKWTGSKDFTGKPTMGFAHSSTHGALFFAVAFTDEGPQEVNKLWMGDDKPGLYMGDDGVSFIAQGDERVWQP